MFHFNLEGRFKATAQIFQSTDPVVECQSATFAPGRTPIVRKGSVLRIWRCSCHMTYRRAAWSGQRAVACGCFSGNHYTYVYSSISSAGACGRVRISYIAFTRHIILRRRVVNHYAGSHRISVKAFKHNIGAVERGSGIKSYCTGVFASGVFINQTYSSAQRPVIKYFPFRERSGQNKVAVFAYRRRRASAESGTHIVLVHTVAVVNMI